MRSWVALVLLVPAAFVWGSPPETNQCICTVGFRTPMPVRVDVLGGREPVPAQAHRVPWVRARLSGDTNSVLELGSRVVLQLENPTALSSITGALGLRLARVVSSNVFVLAAQDAPTAVAAAQVLAARGDVLACYPVMRRAPDMRGPYAQRSNDPYFCPYFYTGGGQYVEAQWPMENRDYDGRRLGFDLNVLGAWAYATGEGVTVAVADTGLDFVHPELTNRLAGAPHFNFDTGGTNASPYGGGTYDPLKVFWTHGTSVAGLIAAEAGNARGMAGVAPGAKLASWLIFTTNAMLVDDERLMDMYQCAPNEVQIQNHSWGSGTGTRQSGPTLLEQIGIERALELGRNGLGTVMVRAAGNDRGHLARADDDAYVNHPGAIAVGAVARGGQVTDYSEPGACVLVAAPGGGSGYQGLLTLDLQGSERGVNSGIYYFTDYADYRTGAYLGFSGTSAAAPLVSGIAALMLAANPRLGYRDVQQILVLASRQVDPSDPDLRRNGAGLVTSHNTGFGVPDAGFAVWLARQWPNRPPLTTLTMSKTSPVQIPDAGLVLEVFGPGVPPELALTRCLPAGLGAHPDEPTAMVPLVDVGIGTNLAGLDLTQKGALIRRSELPFATVLGNVAQAGAAFAVICNWTNDPGFDLSLLPGTDRVRIPAVFISHAKGEALRALFQSNTAVRARLGLESAVVAFDVTGTLACEHVGVRIRIDHPLRGDLRITLVSPQGTRSVFAHLNDDTNAAVEWTYWSTHHFFESSAGRWTVYVTDEAPGATGVIRSASLIVRGVQIADADHDGLDDRWESARIGHCGLGPTDDPDLDGFNNACEQVMGTDPLLPDQQFKVDLGFWSLWGYRAVRLSWPSTPNVLYTIATTTNLAEPFTVLTNYRGALRETEFFDMVQDAPVKFYRVDAWLAQ